VGKKGNRNKGKKREEKDKDEGNETKRLRERAFKMRYGVLVLMVYCVMFGRNTRGWVYERTRGKKKSGKVVRAGGRKRIQLKSRRWKRKKVNRE